MDNNFTPITPESESAAAVASEEATIYTPPVIVRDEPETTAEAPVSSEKPVNPTSVPEKRSLDFAKIFASPLYRAICVLITVLFAFTFIGRGEWLFPLLFMIAAWITYGKAKKNESPVSGVRFTKGILTAQYVLLYVLGGILILFGAGLVALHFTTGFTFKEIIDETVNAFELYKIDNIPFVGNALSDIIKYVNEAYQMLVNDFASVGVSESALHSIMFISISMCLALVGAIVLLFNVLCTRALVVFSDSVCKSADDPNAEIIKAKAVKNWLMVVGIITAIFILWNFWSLFTLGVTAAAMICGSVFVKNNFAKEK